MRKLSLFALAAVAVLGVTSSANAATAQVAVKLESVKTSLPQLLYEVKLYKNLRGDGCVPKLRWHGKEEEHNVMVLDRLGPSLEDLVRSGVTFSLERISAIGIQILDCLEHVHSKEFVHRDIKPGNLVMGMDESEDKVHIVDFGLAKRYRYPKTGKHIPYRNTKVTFTGNMAFASINSHLGIESSRRDDLESVGYLLAYLCRGNLPWFPFQDPSAVGETRAKSAATRKKLTTSLRDVCKGCPRQLSQYIRYCKELSFEDVPDYAFLRELLRAFGQHRRSSYPGDGNFVESAELAYESA
jgi:casein kinase I family protein HRR25